MADTKKKVALLSTSNRQGLVTFARLLVECDYEIVSTGGTAAELRDNGIEVIEVSQLTGAPEILDGRVKTLHPYIHGGLLALRYDADHLMQLERMGIRQIDIVVNNLYPFVETVQNPNAMLKDALENIDIGGPAMTRAAAKNHPSIVILVDPKDYDRVGEMIRGGEVSQSERRRLAAKAFQHVAAYDTAIAKYLREESAVDEIELPQELTFGFSLAAHPRYGENPHQRAGIYASPGEHGGVVNAEQLHGIDMSYLNYLDADSAWLTAQTFTDFGLHTTAVVKHANPCGLAVSEDQTEAWEKARAGDPVSAFGGIVAFSKCLETETAIAMKGLLLDVVIAPDYEPEALAHLRTRRRTRVLKVVPHRPALWDVRTVSGGALVQELDAVTDDDFKDARVVTVRTPTESEYIDLQFAWRACRYVKSNAIVFVKDRALVGVGAGQPNRVTSVRLSARVAGEQSTGSVMASDAFIPFPDAVEVAAAAGVRAVVQPGGSVNDDAVISAANDGELAMVFTGRRHFYH